MALIIAIAFVAAGCASSSPLELEPTSTAKALGVPGCNVSVSMSPPEVIDFLKRWSFHSNPEMDPEWIKISKAYQPGDQLRLVSCTSGGYYFALIREHSIVIRFDIRQLD